jgi:hypothetical protein
VLLFFLCHIVFVSMVNGREGQPVFFVHHPQLFFGDLRLDKSCSRLVCWVEKGRSLNGLTLGTIRDVVIFCGLSFLIGNHCIYFFHVLVVLSLDAPVNSFKFFVGVASPVKSVLSLCLKLFVDLLESVVQGANFLLAGYRSSRTGILNDARFRQNFFLLLFLFWIRKQFNFVFQLFKQLLNHEYLMFQFVLHGENFKGLLAQTSFAAVPNVLRF